MGKHAHMLPVILLPLQVPFYIWAFWIKDGYDVYANFINHFLYDSALLYVYFVVTNKKWFIENTYCLCVLVTLWLINLYALVFGFSWEGYHIICLGTAVIAWMIPFFLLTPKLWSK
jgi:hypothetical protein